MKKNTATKRICWNVHFNQGNSVHSGIHDKSYIETLKNLKSHLTKTKHEDDTLFFFFCLASLNYEKCFTIMKMKDVGLQI